MSTIWDDTGYPLATDRVPRRIVVLRGRWRRVRKAVGCDLREVVSGTESAKGEGQNVQNAPEQTARQPIAAFASDCAGSPSESRCSETHLANILAVRDELEANKLLAEHRKRQDS